MNTKTTIVLASLIVFLGLLFWVGPMMAPSLGLAPKAVEISDAGSYQELAKLPVESVTRIEIQAPEREAPLVLSASETGKPLALPGNWPIRRHEVDELMNVLRDLKSRYHPIAIDDKTNLEPYGLKDDQKPIRVEIEAGKVVKKLKFGEAPLKSGENPFTRACYVLVEGKKEILRLGPQVMPILRRDEDAYRLRQLFPEAIRARVAERRQPKKGPKEDPDALPAKDFLLSGAAVKITIDTPSGKFVLQRVGAMPQSQALNEQSDDELGILPAKLAEAWVLVEPVKDRVDPDKVKAILTAIPNLWLEKFVETPAGSDSIWGLGSHPAAAVQLLALLGGIPSSPSVLPTLVDLAILNEIKSPSASVTVDFENGSSRTLQIGRVSRTIGSDSLRFARIANNPFVFELKGDKLSDLQINLAPSSSPPASVANDLRDPLLVRFDVDSVAGVELTYPGQRVVELVKDGKEWKLTKPIASPAESKEAADLVDLVKKMDARRDDVVESPKPISVLGMLTIDPIEYLGLKPDVARKLVLSFDAKSGRPPVTLLFGRHIPTMNKRGVMVQGWNRLNLIDDKPEANQVSLLDRPPSNYLQSKLFESPFHVLGEIIVERPAGSYTLQEQPGSPPKWSIIAPFKADADLQDANRLSSALDNLGNFKYVYDSRTDEPFRIAGWPTFMTSLGVTPPDGDAIFGLDPPAMTITLKLSQPKGAPDVVLEIGRARSATDYYARRKGTTGVFVVPSALVKAADQKAEDFVDKSLIKIAGEPPAVQTIRRTMAGQDLEFEQNGKLEWEIKKPSVAKADQMLVEDLVQQFTNLRATRIEAVTPKSLKEYGLEPPVATLTIEVLERNKLIEKVLLVGNPVDPMNPKGDRFVKAQGSPMVAVLSGPLTEQSVMESRKFRDLALGGFTKADRIVFDQPDRKITFLKGAGGWRVKEPLDADAEDESLSDLHALLARIRAEEIVEDKATDLAKYGLDKPTRVKIFDGDKEVFELLIGGREKLGKDKKTDGIRSYAKLGKGDAVFLLDWRTTHQLQQEYRKRDLWEPLPPMAIKEILLKSAEGKDGWTFTKGPLGWMDPEKPEERLDNIQLSELVQTLSSMRIDRFVVDKDADLKKYGLDKPRTLTIMPLKGKNEVLLIGKLDGKQLYAKSADPARTDVFLIGISDTEAINRPRADYTLKVKEEPKKEEPKKEEPKKEEPKKEEPKKVEPKKSDPKKEEPKDEPKK